MAATRLSPLKKAQAGKPEVSPQKPKPEVTKSSKVTAIKEEFLTKLKEKDSLEKISESERSFGSKSLRAQISSRSSSISGMLDQQVFGN